MRACTGIVEEVEVDPFLRHLNGAHRFKSKWRSRRSTEEKENLSEMDCLEVSSK